MSAPGSASKDLMVKALRRNGFNREALSILFDGKSAYRAREVVAYLEKIAFQGDKREFLRLVGYTDRDAIVETLAREGKI
jgi:hypothetical protein